MFDFLSVRRRPHAESRCLENEPRAQKIKKKPSRVNLDYIKKRSFPFYNIINILFFFYFFFEIYSFFCIILHEMYKYNNIL